jgi:hypothetical protein
LLALPFLASVNDLMTLPRQAGQTIGDHFWRMQTCWRKETAKLPGKFKWAGDQEAVTVSLATSPFDPETDRR